MSALILFALAGASAISRAIAQGTVPLQPPSSPPAGTSGYIHPSFAGFGIEPSNLFSFTGYSTANQLTINLLNNLANYTGAPANIRIGGNTQDYMVYSDSQTEWTWITNPNAKGQGAYASDSMLIGPRFYEAANRFPAGTPITYGLNLAYDASDYITQLTTMATQAVTKLTNLNVISMEIGNEPDLYLANGFRTGTWDGRTYTQQWLDRASAVYNQVLKPNGLPVNFFEPGTTASTIGTSFQINDLNTFDITADANGSSNSYVARWNQHDYYYYIGVSTYPLTMYSFMTLSTTSDQFSAWRTQIQQANTTGYQYALREMGIVGPIGMAGITDTFAAALWQLNFLLYAASLNIYMVGMHMTDNSAASAWMPLAMKGVQPHVRPSYYGFAAFDQAIGPSCQAQVSSYEIAGYPDGYGGRLVAYSVFQAGQLSSIVIINSQMTNVTNTTKGSLTIDLSLPSFAGKSLYLAYLTNDGADATSGTTFNGVSYEESGTGMPTTVGSSNQVVAIGSDGSASVTLRDSQAVVAQIGTPVGQIKANASACSSLARAAGSGSGSSSSSSQTSSSAANSNTKTGSTARATSTNGVAGISTMILFTLSTSFISGALLLWS